jgi:HK97 family phage major capsid protein
VEAAAVEAARPTVSVTNVRERVAPLTSGQYLDAQIKAAMGDDNARRTILAADDSTSTNTGLTLPGHLQQCVTTTFSGRPAFEAVTRQALPDSSMSFTIPKLGTAPTVAETAEATAPSETGMTSTYDTVTVKQYSGLNRISTILLDRSSPAFMDLLMTEMRKAYEKATDAALIAAFTASGTQATGVAATAAGLQSFIATESAAAYKATGGNYANKLVASTDQWAAINGYVDGSSRPLYAAQGQTQNASGAVVPTSVVGNVLGTSLIVDHNISVSGIVDESAFLVAPESVYVWESPTTQLRVNVLTTSEVEICLYGYMAIGVLKGGVGVRRFNLS